MTAESTASKKARIMGSWLVAEKSRFTSGDAAAHLSKQTIKVSSDTARTILYALYLEGKLARHVAPSGSVTYSGNVVQVLYRPWVKPWVQSLKCSPEWC